MSLSALRYSVSGILFEPIVWLGPSALLVSSTFPTLYDNLSAPGLNALDPCHCDNSKKLFYCTICEQTQKFFYDETKSLVPFVLYKINGVTSWCWQQMVRKTISCGWHSSMIPTIIQILLLWNAMQWCHLNETAVWLAHSVWSSVHLLRTHHLYIFSQSRFLLTFTKCLSFRVPLYFSQTAAKGPCFQHCLCLRPLNLFVH